MFENRPHWIYGDGDEPDYRFTLANERTFLAWVRTALALLAAGVFLDHLDPSVPAQVSRWLSTVLVILGMACAAAAWLRWARAERSMRRGGPLPRSQLTGLIAVIIVAVSLAVAIAWR